MKKLIILTTCIVIGFAACKKGGVNPIPVPPPISPKTYADFLKNTEWVGTDDGHRSQYPRPADLKFHSDGTITIYSIFNLSADGGVTITKADSISGKINKIDSLADGSTHVSVNFPDIGGDQIIIITNRKDLTMSPADPAKLTFNSHSYGLTLFPSAGVSLSSTSWSGQLINPNDLPSSYCYYPDLSTVTFSTINGNAQVSYTRKGIIVQQQTGAGIGILQIAYHQIGARVYLFGYDEDYSWDMDIAISTGNYTDYRQGRVMQYFGVLMPSGDKMMVDSRSANARLPYYTQTVDRYGPAGVTPVITKQ